MDMRRPSVTGHGVQEPEHTALVIRATVTQRPEVRHEVPVLARRAFGAGEVTRPAADALLQIAGDHVRPDEAAVLWRGHVRTGRAEDINGVEAGEPCGLVRRLESLGEA